MTERDQTNAAAQGMRDTHWSPTHTALQVLQDEGKCVCRLNKKRERKTSYPAPHSHLPSSNGRTAEPRRRSPNAASVCDSSVCDSSEGDSSEGDGPSLEDKSARQQVEDGQTVKVERGAPADLSAPGVCTVSARLSSPAAEPLAQLTNEEWCKIANSLC